MEKELAMVMQNRLEDDLVGNAADDDDEDRSDSDQMDFDKQSSSDDSD